MKRTHLFECVSQDELRLAFSIAFLEVTDAFSGSYSIHRYATPGYEGPTRDWLELFMRAIRFLALEKGYEFEALQVSRSGSIGGVRRVCPANLNYVILLDGGLPDVEIALRHAVEFAEQRVPSLDAEPLKQALAQVRRDVAMAMAQADPEETKLIREHRREAFRALADERVN